MAPCVDDAGVGQDQMDQPDVMEIVRHLVDEVGPAQFAIDARLFQEGFTQSLEGRRFAAGIGVGLLLEKNRLPSRAWGFGLILAALLIWTLVQVGGLFTELWRPLLWGVPALLTVTGALAIEAGGSGAAPRGLIHRGLIGLGDASYAIYLVHLPATAVLAHTLGYNRPWLFLPLAVVVSVLAGLATRAWIEIPLMTAVRGGASLIPRAT